jgi:uncharacterized protein
VVIPDANILIYSHYADSPQHRQTSDWLERQFSGRETIGMTWFAIWAFVRIGSNARVWPRPPSMTALFDRVDEWLDRPNVVVIHPGPRHRNLLEKLVFESGVTGALVSDAALAAIAIEHAATLASTDRDFRRFSGLRWINPLEDQA